MAIINLSSAFSQNAVASKPTASKAATSDAEVNAFAASAKAAGAYDSCLKLSPKSLRWLSSQSFAKKLEECLLRKEYADLIEDRKNTLLQVKKEERIAQLLDVMIEEIVETNYDGFNYTFTEVKCLCKGIRSQAIREAKKAHGFNACFWWAFTKALEENSFVRALLKKLNSPTIK